MSIKEVRNNNKRVLNISFYSFFCSISLAACCGDFPEHWNKPTLVAERVINISSGLPDLYPSSKSRRDKSERKHNWLTTHKHFLIGAYKFS